MDRISKDDEYALRQYLEAVFPAVYKPTRRFRHYLVKLAYLGKGVLESLLGEVRRPTITQYGETGHGKTFGSEEQRRAYYDDEHTVKAYDGTILRDPDVR